MAEPVTEAPAPGSPEPESEPLPAHTRVVVIGAGFAGLGTAIRLRQAGIEDFVVLERGNDVGGTWRDNSYPGCACDVPSHLYSFSFAPNPNWSRSFSPQPEIWDYLRDCADRFGVTAHLRLGVELLEAEWVPETQQWRLQTSRGPMTCQVLVGGMGGLVEPKLPDLPGLDRFQGAVFHSARWDHHHELDGERVAVVGTGASAIQLVPEIAPQVQRLNLFQRTAPWVMPRRDRDISFAERRLYRRLPAAQRLMREGIYWARELFVLNFRHPRLMRLTGERIARRHLQNQVPDPVLREKLTPHYRMGCKRVLISNDYLPALTRPNVEVVTDGIAEVREHSIVTSDGQEREVDTIIFGTGFEATDQPFAHHVRGKSGRTLAEEWSGSMQAHLGTTVAGFPNLFLLLGPNTGLGHNSVVVMIEAQITYLLDALQTMNRRSVASIEVRPEAQSAYNEWIQQRLGGTVWVTGGCASWYKDAHGRITTLWPGSTWPYRRLLRRFDGDSYVMRARTTVGSPAPAIAA